MSDLAQNKIEQPKENIENRVLIGFLFFLLILVIIVWTAIKNSKELIQSIDWFYHTHSVLMTTEATLRSLHEAESFWKSYVINNDTNALVACKKAFSEMSESIDVALNLTADNPAEHTNFKRLEDLVNSRVKRVRDLMQSGNLSLESIALTKNDIDSLNEIKSIIVSIENNEKALLFDRHKTLNARTDTTRRILFSGLSLNLILLVVLIWIIRVDLHFRRRAAEALQAANESLEIKVQERTAELLAAKERLEIENIETRWAHESIKRLFHYDELIINSIGEGIFIVSRKGNIIRLNSSAPKLTGWTASELTGKSIKTVIKISDTEKLQHVRDKDPIFATIKDGVSFYGISVELIRKDGTETPSILSSHPIFAEGKVVGVVLVVRPK
jgi:PAS domain S-box-containing protein